MAASPLSLLRSIFIVAALGALALPAAASATTSQTTRLHTLRVFEGGRLAPGLSVRASVRGSCWTESLVESRPYSWRCVHGNYIHDPCFSLARTSRTVVCPDAPWNDRVLVLALTERLPAWHFYSRTVSAAAWPWGIVTRNGKRCITAAGAATGEIAGKQVTYVCAGGGLLAGFTHRQTAAWTIDYAPGWTSKRLTMVGIADAWLS
jgi:hypothetical protein